MFKNFQVIDFLIEHSIQYISSGLIVMETNKVNRHAQPQFFSFSNECIQIQILIFFFFNGPKSFITIH